MQKQLTQTLKILIAAMILSAGISYAYAWVGPQGPPPTSNTLPPLVSTTDTEVTQSTDGILIVTQGFGTMGNITAEGNLTVDNDVSALNYCDETGLICTAGSALGGAAGKWNDVTGGISYSAGNVGIGTNAPEGALHITKPSNGASATQGVILGTSGDYSSIELKGASDSRGGGFIDFGYPNDDFKARIMYNNVDNTFRFNNQGDRLTIAENGSVGIGTTNPGAKLEVVGNFKTNAFYFDGNNDNWLRLRDGEEGAYKDFAAGQIYTSDGIYIANKKFSKIRYANLGEDSYAPWGTGTGGIDTCNGSKVSEYSCTSTEERACIDYKRQGFGSTGRTVTCLANGYATIY